MVKNNQHNAGESKSTGVRKIIVEADFQLLMRIFVNERMVGVIEKYEIISKGNYGSRKGCSMCYLTLEKKLLHDCSMQNME